METNSNTPDSMLYKISAAAMKTLAPKLDKLNFIVRIQDIDESNGTARLSLYRSDIEVPLSDLQQAIDAPQDQF